MADRVRSGISRAALTVGAVLQALPVFLPLMDLPAALCSLCWPLFLLLYTRRVSRHRQMVCGGVVFYISFCVRYACYLGGTVKAVLLLCGIFIPVCAALWLTFAADRLLFRRRAGVPATLVFPVLYTLITVLMNQLGLPVLGDPACAVIFLPAVAQCASLLLSYGLCFLALWVASLAALAVCDTRLSRRIPAAVIAVVLIVSVSVYGCIRFSHRVAPCGTLRVAMFDRMDSDFTADSYPYTEEEAAALFEKHLAFSRKNGADLAVTTEEYLYYPYEQKDEWLQRLSGTVNRYGVPVLLSVEESVAVGSSYNKSYLFDGEGRIVREYTKVNLVPFLENDLYVKGNNDPGEWTLDVNGSPCRIAFLICYDSSNPLFTRRISPDAQVLINPCWEWDTPNAELRRSVALRAVENNVTLLKNTYDGWSYAVTPYGEFTGVTDTRALAGQAYMTDVPLYRK